jgi:hypothetical protein
MIKFSITPAKVLGAIVFGSFIMWLGSAFEFILWLRLTLLIAGFIILMCASIYCLRSLL